MTSYLEDRPCNSKHYTKHVSSLKGMGMRLVSLQGERTRARMDTITTNQVCWQDSSALGGGIKGLKHPLVVQYRSTIYKVPNALHTQKAEEEERGLYIQ